jgi:hypothetical protein
MLITFIAIIIVHNFLTAQFFTLILNLNEKYLHLTLNFMLLNLIFYNFSTLVHITATKSIIVT